MPEDNEPQPAEVEGIPLEHPMYEKTMAEIRATGSIGVSAIPGIPGGLRLATITEQLQNKKAFLETQLANINDALAKIQEQSTTMALLEALAKANKDY